MAASRRRLIVAALVLAVASTVPVDLGAVPTASAGGNGELVAALSPHDQATFDAQIAAAMAATRGLATPEQAAAAGYRQSSTQLPGIGTHWINWDLVDRPFDPAHPSMLLFDQSPLHEPRLAGFSYWVRSTNPPDGFAGPNDQWHRHSGMCFEDGWLRRENVAPTDCSGQYVDGADLWMLHTWIVPGYANRDGVFAPRNDALCPPYFAQVPDPLRCDAPGNAALPGGHGDPAAPLPADGSYCHLPLQ